MQVNAAYQANSTSTYNKSTNSDEIGSTLDTNDFFKLITAQLQNQSMFSPVDDTQFMAQMAQFTTLQQIKDLSNTFQSTYSVSLLGKNVTVNSFDENGILQQITGSVDKVNFENGQAELFVNGNYYKTGDIVEVLK